MSSFMRAWILACFAVPAALGPWASARAQGGNAAGPTTAGPKGEEVFNKLPGQTTITYIRPEGTLVKKGDLVCELDASSLKARLASQEVATKEAEAAYQNAKLPREVAEIGVTEYLEGVYKQEKEMLLGKIAISESELKQAEGRLARSKSMVEQKKLPRDRMVTDELAVQRIRLALEQALRKRDTLEKYTKEKMVKKLQSEVEKARSEELARQSAYLLAQSARERVQKQLENCRLLAPISGRLHYSEPIGEAADVREGQLLFRVVPEEGPDPGAR
jgi:HlyD family secretion protein